MTEQERQAATQSLLLALVRPVPPERGAGDATLIEQADWPFLIERARAHKVAALVGARVAALGWMAQLTAPTRAEFEAVAATARDRAERARATLQAVVPALTARRIPVLVMKGRVLAEQAYRDPNLRPFFDVDLVVPESHLAEAECALNEVGFRFHHALTVRRVLSWGIANVAGALDERLTDDQARHIYRTFHQHLQFAHADERYIGVELHWHVRPPGRIRLDADGIWPHTQPAVVAGVPALSLQPDAMVLHTAAHAIGDGVNDFRLLHLIDIAWLLHRLDGQIDAARLWARARSWQVHGDLACALQLLEDLAGMPPTMLLDWRRYQGGVARALLRAAVRTAGLVTMHWSAQPTLRFAQDVGRNALWTLATRRFPREAVATLSSRVRLRWRTRTVS